MAHEINFVARDHHFVFYMNQTRINRIENITVQSGVTMHYETSVSEHVTHQASGYSVEIILLATEYSSNQ